MRANPIGLSFHRQEIGHAPRSGQQVTAKILGFEIIVNNCKKYFALDTDDTLDDQNLILQPQKI